MIIDHFFNTIPTPPACRRQGAYPLSLAILSLFFQVSAPALAETGMDLAGAEIARDTAYLYVGRIFSAAGPLGYGRVYRLWLDGGSYQYDKNTARIDARYSRISAAVGHHEGGEQGWWSAYFGIGARHTTLSPDDPTAASRGNPWYSFVQWEGERAIASEWRLNAGISYVLGQDAYWLRGRLSKSLPSQHRLGGEIVVHGDPDYQVRQIGVLWAFPVISKNEVLLKAGARTSQGHASSPYAGIEFMRPF